MKKLYEFDEFDPFSEETIGNHRMLDMRNLYKDYEDGYDLKNYLEPILYGKRINVFDKVEQKIAYENILVNGIILRLNIGGTRRYRVAIKSADSGIIETYGFDTIEILN